MPMAHAFYREFGRLLKNARSRPELSLTQEQVGELVGLSRSSIANLERGEQQMPLHLFPRFAEALQVSPLDLLPTSESHPEVEELAVRTSLPPSVKNSLSRVLRNRPTQGDQ
jgi:transcriptional regulator with XRE-family HTH domain